MRRCGAGRATPPSSRIVLAGWARPIAHRHRCRTSARSPTRCGQRATRWCFVGWEGRVSPPRCFGASLVHARAFPPWPCWIAPRPTRFGRLPRLPPRRFSSFRASRVRRSRRRASCRTSGRPLEPTPRGLRQSPIQGPRSSDSLRKRGFVASLKAIAKSVGAIQRSPCSVSFPPRSWAWIWSR